MLERMDDERLLIEADFQVTTEGLRCVRRMEGI